MQKVYKAKFEFAGSAIAIRAHFYAGRAETRYEPEEESELELIEIRIDSKDVSQLEDAEICELLDIDDYEDFISRCGDEIYSQNEEHITKLRDNNSQLWR